METRGGWGFWARSATVFLLPPASPASHPPAQQHQQTRAAALAAAHGFDPAATAPADRPPLVRAVLTSVYPTSLAGWGGGADGEGPRDLPPPPPPPAAAVRGGTGGGGDRGTGGGGGAPTPSRASPAGRPGPHP
jgi:hypothetical protein